MDGASGYSVVHPDDDPRRDYRAIYDVSGDATLLDTLIARLAPGGEIVLAGFYSEPLVVRLSRRPSCARRGSASPRNGASPTWPRPRTLVESGRCARRPDHPSAARQRGAGGLPHRFHRSLVPENDPRLESPLMSTAFATSGALRAEQLRLEAARRGGDRARCRCRATRPPRRRRSSRSTARAASARASRSPICPT